MDPVSTFFVSKSLDTIISAALIPFRQRIVGQKTQAELTDGLVVGQFES